LCHHLRYFYQNILSTLRGFRKIQTHQKALFIKSYFSEVVRWREWGSAFTVNLLAM